LVLDFLHGLGVSLHRLGMEEAIDILRIELLHPLLNNQSLMKQLHLPVLRSVLRFRASDFKGRLKVECVQIRERIAELMEHVYPAHAHLDVDLVGLLDLQLLNVFN